MQPTKYAIISAAGLGSRLELNMPKCLVDIGKAKIIDYQLALLNEIENIRIIVGFMENEVINYVKQIRSDVVFVRNPYYLNTTNSYSLHLATRDLNEPFLIMDGDLLIDQDSFNNFLANCPKDKNLIGITPSKTEEAVFVDYDQKSSTILSFSRSPKTTYEWCGVAVLNGVQIAQDGGYIYSQLEKMLPLPAAVLDCFEIDTPEDLNYAMKHFKG